MGPTSSISSNSSADAFAISSIEPKLFANVWAVASPTSRIPSAYKNLANVVFLLTAIAPIKLDADFSAIRSKLTNLSTLRS